VTGPVPLTPVQCWFFEHELPKPHHWNQSLLLEVEPGVSDTLLEQVWQSLLAQHDALRLHFTRRGNSWQQHNAGLDEYASFSRMDLVGLKPSGQRAAIESAAVDAESSLNLSEGPPARFIFFNLGSTQPARLLIVIHHLVVDGLSWRILLEDLQRGYEQLSRGEVIEFAPKTTSYQEWAEHLAEFAQSPALLQEAQYWLAEERRQIKPLPVDMTGGAGTQESERMVEVSLTVEETRALLQDVPRAYRTEINDVLLTALAEAFAQWTGERRVLVDLEGHGREEVGGNVDVSRTVGWFTTVFPVMLELEGDSKTGLALKSVKEQLRRIPQRGIGYGLVRYLTGNRDIEARLQSMPPAEVLFNYLGQHNQMVDAATMVRPAQESAGATRDAQGRRSHLFEIGGTIAGGRLQFVWAYSEQAHRRETVSRLAELYVQSLRSLIAHCQSQEADGHTPSDFPLARMGQQQLDQLTGANRQIEDIYPLSPMQQGILFHALYTLAAEEYFEQISSHLQTRVNTEVFEQAWQRAVERQSVLRTSFVWEGLIEPLQLVHRHVLLRLEQHDWRDRSANEQQESLREFLAGDRRRGFDLSAAPLMRLNLICLGEQSYQFVLSYHHILLDGWATSQLLQEVFALYEAFCEGKNLQLEPAVPYSDYIAWLQQQDMKKAETFWRAELEGLTRPTALAGRIPAGPVTAAPGLDEQRILISTAATAALQSFAQQNQLTLNTLVQGAWALMLSRYTGERDVVFGTTVSGRPATLQGIESRVGLFINTLPVRVQINPQAQLVSWLRDLQQKQAELQQYEYSPLVQIQGWSDVPRGVPIFESLLVFESYPVDRSIASSTNLGIDDVFTFDQTSYPLTIEVVPGQEVFAKITYDRRLFAQPMIQRMLGHFEHILSDFITYPEKQLSMLSMVTRAEREQLQQEWNETEAEYPSEECFGELFEEQERETSEQLAVAAGGMEVTYGELEERASGLAGELERLGVGPESVVGLVAGRGLDLLTAVVAVFKVGAAYLPLDGGQPGARVAEIIGRSGAQVLLVSAEFRERVGQSLEQQGEVAVTVCGLEEMLGAGERGRGSGAQSDAGEGPAGSGARGAGGVESGGEREGKKKRGKHFSADNLAYVIYTSGSSGQPKGAMIQQRGMINHLWAKRRELGMSARDRVAQTASQCFDISVWQMLAPLLVGASCHILGDEVAHDPGGLLREVAGEGITILEVVPTMLRAMLEVEPAVALPELRYLLVTGEALPAELVRGWKERYPEVGLINAYGPTECSDDVTQYRAEEMPGAGASRVAIGSGLQNTRLYVLDERMELVAGGVAGELYVGGDGVGRGYLGEPARTAAAFVADPYGSEPGGRLYRTGDMVRYVGERELEFLGRVDEQVKVRGYRIELGEIEAVVGEQQGVRACAVVVSEEAGEKRLVAYVELQGGAGRAEEGAGEEGVGLRELTVGELRRQVRERLPEYMRPALYVIIAELPLNANGKVDRRQLAALEVRGAAAAEAGEEYQAPETEMELVVARVWGEVLRVSGVGRQSNFFELGGHSLLATQVVSRLRLEAGVEVALRSLFEHPTLAALAALVELSSKETRDARVPPIARAPRNSVLPLSYAQQRLWFLNQLAPESAFYTIPVIFRLDGPLSVPVLERSVYEVLKRHEILRTTFPVVNGWPVQKIGPARLNTIAVIDLSALDVVERERTALQLATREAQGSFDLSRDLLIRACLLRLDANEHLVVMTIHHIVTDAWSMALMIEELAVLYKAFINGEPSPLAELPIQYADFAIWQRRWLQGEAMEEQLRYWKKQLGGQLPALNLPGARPRPPVQTFSGKRRIETLPLSLIEAVRDLGRREGATLFMTLLAAFQTLLYRYSGQDDIIMGSPISSRPQVQTERLIGCFLNVLALRIDLSGDPSFRDLLGRVRTVALGAFAHQDVPFEKVVEAVPHERVPGHAPLFDVSFSLINTPPARTEMFQDLTLTPLDIDTGTSQFDLIAIMDEVGEGLKFTLMYCADLFDEQFIGQMMSDFATLLGSIVRQPDARLNDLELVTEVQKEQRIMERIQREELKRRKFMSIKFSAMDLTQESLVRMGELQPGQSLPLLVQPDVRDVDLVEWVKSNQSLIETELRKRGGILFRGFNVKSAEDFSGLTSSLCRRMMKYQERSTPRTEVAENIYTSTEYPAEQFIALHNEFSYARTWPMKIWFFCQEAAAMGGETPIADSRLVYQRMDPEVRQRFASRGVRYVRHYGSGIDLPWQTVFQTDSRAEVEAYCRQAPIEWQWLGDDRLKTWQIRQGVAAHPQTGEMVWFNQAHLFHVSNLEREVRESLVATFGEEGLPRQAWYGDGGEIEEEALAEVRRAYEEVLVEIEWRQGDVLLLDNMLVAHGRRPYSGPRKILAALAEPFKADEPST